MLFFCKATLLAQQKICYGSITRYSVDGSENLGKGSIGCTYQWGVKEPNFKGFITSVSLDRTNDINVKIKRLLFYHYPTQISRKSLFV